MYNTTTSFMKEIILFCFLYDKVQYCHVYEYILNPEPVNGGPCMWSVTWALHSVSILFIKFENNTKI